LEILLNVRIRYFFYVGISKERVHMVAEGGKSKINMSVKKHVLHLMHFIILDFNINIEHGSCLRFGNEIDDPF
jgi:hypothetical protein